jgi:hypothetical protein
MIESDSHSVVMNNLRPDSISHSSHDLAVGRVNIVRMQTRPIHSINQGGELRPLCDAADCPPMRK